MSQLSETSGVPIASIKYYLREGLLQPGERSSANQSDYGDEHVKRLRLIRALIDVGGLSIATARSVLAVIDDPETPLGHVLGAAQHAVSNASTFEPVTEATNGTRLVDAFIESAGWIVASDNPGRMGAARVIDSYERIGQPELAIIPEGYARASELIARVDLDWVANSQGMSSKAETVIVGTVLGDALLASLRRMAQENRSCEIFPNSPHKAVTEHTEKARS
ncbi:MAG: MerR family transcriptional regulator [Salinibacterium sp.]|nr:MAG: MerR family transcriptional regulator [Salinibacterium sp.]